MTGGDDGRVVATVADGETLEIADEKGRWIDALALRGGAIAWAAGKRGSRARRRRRGQDPGPRRRRCAAWPSMPQGLSPGARPLQRRLAVVSERRGRADPPRMEGLASRRRPPRAGRALPRHLDAGERAARLARRRRAQHAHDRLSRARRARCRGRTTATWLATSGADACVVWPFKDKDGPMGKAPRECGVRSARVVQVAFHPRALVVAIGYSDGLILLCRLADAAEILVRERRATARSARLAGTRPARVADRPRRRRRRPADAAGRSAAQVSADRREAARSRKEPP